MYFGFKIKTVARQDEIFQSKGGNVLDDINLDKLLLELKAQRKVPQDCSLTQMCDMFMAPFKFVFSDGLEALRQGLSTIKCGNPLGIKWQKRMAPLENTPEARKERKALIKKEDAKAEVARKKAMRDAHKPSRSGKHKAPEPKVDTAKKQKMMPTVTPRVTRASASAHAEAMVATHVAKDVAKDGIEGDATMFDGPDWEAMYEARARALVRERIRKMAFRVAQAVNLTDNDEMDRSYAPVNDEDHGGRTAPEAVPQQADTAAPLDTDSFFV